MKLPLSIWAPIGKEAWWAGRQAIATGEFVFDYTPEDHVMSDLKNFAATYAYDAIERLQETHDLLPAHQAQLTLMYIRTFVNGAIDQNFSEQQPSA
jgi:hypothetical protein